MKKITLKSVLFLGLLLIGTSCTKKSETETIADAQHCLDTATQASAASCIEMVSGMESKGSYLIRCVAMYLQEGFSDPNRMKDAMSSLQSGQGGDSSLAMMSIMAFKNGGNSTINQNNATTTNSYCNSSGSKGLIMLSALSATATVVSSLAATDCSIAADPAACMAASMANVASNPAGQQIIGAAAVAAYGANCTNGQTAGGALCAQLGSAMAAGATEAQIGAQLAACYNNPALPQCSGF